MTTNPERQTVHPSKQESVWFQLGCLVVVGLFCFLPVWLVGAPKRQARNTLLHQVDHQAVRDAGRRILKDPYHFYPRADLHKWTVATVGAGAISATSAVSATSIWSTGSAWLDASVPPGDSRLPEAMRQLSCRVFIAQNIVVLEFGGGFGHFGFRIFPEGFASDIKEIHSGEWPTFEQRELIEGLWYYEVD